MASSAHRASWHDPRQSGYSVQRGQSAHSVRKHFSLLTDDCWAGWTQFLASHFPQLLQPSSWGFERRGRSTELITFKHSPHTVGSRNFKPQGHKLSKSQCDSSQIPRRWLLQDKARQIEPISSGLGRKCSVPIKMGWKWGTHLESKISLVANGSKNSSSACSSSAWQHKCFHLVHKDDKKVWKSTVGIRERSWAECLTLSFNWFDTRGQVLYLLWALVSLCEKHKTMLCDLQGCNKICKVLPQACSPKQKISRSYSPIAFSTLLGT